MLGELMPHAIMTPREILPAVWRTAPVCVRGRPTTARTIVDSVTAFDMIIAAVCTFEHLRAIKRCAGEKGSLSLGDGILVLRGEIFRTLDRRTGYRKVEIL